MLLQGVMMKIDSYQNIMPGTAYRLVLVLFFFPIGNERFSSSCEKESAT